MDGMFARLAARATGSPKGERPRVRQSPPAPCAATFSRDFVAEDVPSPTLSRIDQDSRTRTSALWRDSNSSSPRADRQSHRYATTRTPRVEKLTTIEKAAQSVFRQKPDSVADDPPPESGAAAMRPTPDAATQEPTVRTPAPESELHTASTIESRETPLAAQRARPIARPPPPVSRRDSRDESAPRVEVTIGVIEVRAATPPTVITQAPASAAPRVEPEPALTIDAYLTERAEGRR